MPPETREPKEGSTSRTEANIAVGPPTTNIAVIGTMIRETSMMRPCTTSV